MIISIISSIASCVAIWFTFYSIYCEKRVGLNVQRVVFHMEGKKIINIILEIKNRKPYPITINELRCYKYKSYKIEKNWGAPPTISCHLLFNQAIHLLTENESHVIDPYALKDLYFKINSERQDFKRLFFSLKTSHGYIESKCKKIHYAEMGSQILSPEIYEWENSRKNAYIKFIQEIIKHYWKTTPIKENLFNIKRFKLWK
jgi:hypothetical protein